MHYNNLFINDGKTYDNTDGCSKKYRFSNTMWLLSVLELLNIMMIYIFINSPGHVRMKIYGINVYENK